VPSIGKISAHKGTASDLVKLTLKKTSKIEWIQGVQLMKSLSQCMGIPILRCKLPVTLTVEDQLVNEFTSHDYHLKLI
jgi:hypothetical protein